VNLRPIGVVRSDRRHKTRGGAGTMIDYDAIAKATGVARIDVKRVLHAAGFSNADEHDLQQENAHLRARLFPYADGPSTLCGRSWNGFYLIGDEKSIKEVERMEYQAAHARALRERVDDLLAKLTAIEGIL